MDNSGMFSRSSETSTGSPSLKSAPRLELMEAWWMRTETPGNGKRISMRSVYGVANWITGGYKKFMSSLPTATSKPTTKRGS
eukprot:2950632-Prorocentrum_lima.AAC.1